MNQHWTGSFAPGRHDPNAPFYPARYDRNLRWGTYEYVCSAIFISLALAFVAGFALLVVHIIGFDSLSHVYGFDRVIEHFDIGPLPST